jgi:pyruvate/2-oxoglutarate dehydrogenase complex dihydrolipoamide dehydrogenase (E3) component
LLGFHIIGPEAASIIQEVADAVAAGGRPEGIFAGIHIHPAMPELVLTTLNNLETVAKPQSAAIMPKR